MLGLPRNIVRLQPYDPAWREIAEHDVDLVKKALDKYAIDVQHVGSTSIEGLDAKPIIDIAVGVTSLDHVDEIAARLRSLGYLRLKVQLEEKVIFAKDIEAGRTHYLHVELYNGNHWNDHVLFRDYLRTHPDVTEAYRLLKRRLESQFSVDVGSYSEHKKGFVDEVLRVARKTGL